MAKKTSQNNLGIKKYIKTLRLVAVFFFGAI